MSDATMTTHRQAAIESTQDFVRYKLDLKRWQANRRKKTQPKLRPLAKVGWLGMMK